jgi:mRNA-degrading endonuclease YafQ of YafQ-DinJ toxin-antitoxin module
MLKKLPENIQLKARERTDIFRVNKFERILDNHLLHAPYAGCRSINITGDYRAIFYEQGDTVIFIAIGTHPQLYGN